MSTSFKKSVILSFINDNHENVIFYINAKKDKPFLPIRDRGEYEILFNMGTDLYVNKTTVEFEKGKILLGLYCDTY